MKEIINFIEANVDGKTLFTKELVYELENVRYRAFTQIKYLSLI